jgi:hypothetical protein
VAEQTLRDGGAPDSRTLNPRRLSQRNTPRALSLENDKTTFIDFQNGVQQLSTKPEHRRIRNDSHRREEESRETGSTTLVLGFDGRQ